MVTSNLQGLGLNLPAPLNKAPDAVLPLRFENTLVRESMLVPAAGGAPRLQDQLIIELGRIVSINYLRDVSGAEARVIRGGIAVGLLPGESAPAPEEGVVANINLNSINIDAWESMLSGAAGASIANVVAEPSRGATTSAAASSYLPTLMAIRAKELTAENRTLHNVVVGGSRDGLTWRANIDAAELNGYLEYRQPAGAGAGRVIALLARFGMKDVVRRGKGKMEGQVSWIGSPLSLDYPTLNGIFNVNVESGQFLKADPGLAKLLGVLSLQALPRRLALDFRDVFSEGFAFDFVRGDVTIEDGVAATNNLQMKGVNAAVLMEGSADIARETQDLKVVVVPEINAGTASLVATVINPAIGIGTFLAQYFLRRPLIDATTQEFHIDGSWADPKITKVPRRLPAQQPGSGIKTGAIP